MEPLIPLFWTSDDISSGFYSQSGQPHSSGSIFFKLYIEFLLLSFSPFSFSLTPQRIVHLLKPSPEWGPAHKVSKMTHLSEAAGAHVMEALHSEGARLKQSSFDNPSFSISNIVYTFDNDDI